MISKGFLCSKKVIIKHCIVNFYRSHTLVLGESRKGNAIRLQKNKKWGIVEIERHTLCHTSSALTHDHSNARNSRHVSHTSVVNFLLHVILFLIGDLISFNGSTYFSKGFANASML